jgi:hypothetical protein
MRSTTLNLPATIMATKPLPRFGYEIRRRVQENQAEVRPLHMDWVVVTDTNGNRRLQIRWRAY